MTSTFFMRRFPPKEPAQPAQPVAAGVGCRWPRPGSRPSHAGRVWPARPASAGRPPRTRWWRRGPTGRVWRGLGRAVNDSAATPPRSRPEVQSRTPRPASAAARLDAVSRTGARRCAIARSGWVRRRRPRPSRRVSYERHAPGEHRRQPRRHAASRRRPRPPRGGGPVLGGIDHENAAHHDLPGSPPPVSQRVHAGTRRTGPKVPNPPGAVEVRRQPVPVGRRDSVASPAGAVVSNR